MSGLQTALQSATRTLVERDEPTATDAGLVPLSLLELDAGTQRLDSREPYLPSADIVEQRVASPSTQSPTTTAGASVPPSDATDAAPPMRRCESGTAATVSPPCAHTRPRQIRPSWIVATVVMATIAVGVAVVARLAPRMASRSTISVPVVPPPAKSASAPSPAAGPTPLASSPSLPSDPAATGDQIPEVPDAEHRLVTPTQKNTADARATNQGTARGRQQTTRVRHQRPTAMATPPHDTETIRPGLRADADTATEPSTPNPFVEVVPRPIRDRSERTEARAGRPVHTHDAQPTLPQESRETANARLADWAGGDAHNVDAIVRLATMAATSGRRGEALKRFDEALQIDPHHSGALAGLLSLIAHENPKRAEQALLQAVSKLPSPSLYFALGNVYAMRTDWHQARAAYAHALAAAPDHADYAYNLAIAYEHLAQPRQALKHYRVAIAATREPLQSGFDVRRVQQRIDILERRIDGR